MKISKIILYLLLSFAAIIALIVILQSKQFEHNWSAAQYSDSRGVTVTMLVYPMFGIHSDWHRKLRVSNGREELEIELFEDTGWWRGSNLYQHSSGALVLVEGSVGCTVIEIYPLSYSQPLSHKGKIDCYKNQENSVMTYTDQGLPISKYYADMVYLGHFSERNKSDDGVYVGFTDHSEQEERVLPGPP